MRIPRHHLLAAPVIALTTSLAQAHHGQEFLVVQDAAVPTLWSGTVFGSAEWSRDGSDDELSQEPGFLLGIAPRVALGTTMGFSGTENDWAYESVSPFLQVQLTPPESRFRVAVVAGYHFADGSSAPAPAGAAAAPVATPVRAKTPKPASPPRPVVVPPPDPDPDPPCGPAYGPDAPPCPDTASPVIRRKLRHAGHVPPTPAPAPGPAPVASAAGKPSASAAPTPARTTPTPPAESYDGIHRHGEDHAFASLVVEADLTSADKLIINLITLWPEQGKPAWGYAAGYRHAFSHALAAGLEAIGDFGDANEHEIVLGGYASPTHHLTFKLGAGLGLTEASPDFSVRTGVVWRF